jgi:hypothetical protein
MLDTVVAVGPRPDVHDFRTQPSNLRARNGDEPFRPYGERSNLAWEHDYDQVASKVAAVLLAFLGARVPLPDVRDFPASLKVLEMC